MTFWANTRVQVAAPSTELDDHGDPVGVSRPSATAPSYRASIIEKTRREQDQTSGMWSTVRYFAGRVDPSTPHEDGSVYFDTRTGRAYVLDESTEDPYSIAGFADVTLTLRATSGQ